MSTGKNTFDVKGPDEFIRVHIEDGFATIRIQMIDDVGIIVEAINRAAAAGATRGTLWTGGLLPQHDAAMGQKRAEKGIKWLGGIVTFLGMGSNGPEFRVDWDCFPTITV